MARESDKAVERLAERVVEAVSTVTNLDVLALDPLYEAIDPDALELLFADRFTGHLEFRYAGCLVTVDSDAGVVVTARQLAAVEGEPLADDS